MKCEVENCPKRPTYSPQGTTAVRCATHRQSGDVQRYIDLCEICHEKTALFNVPGQKKGVRCATHKEPGMRPIRGRFCKECDITNPCFGFQGGKGTHCREHKLDGQINVEKNECEVEGCHVTAKFGHDKKLTRCAKHRLDGMTNPFIKTCEKCEKIPAFGIPGSRATRCREHASNNMIDVISRRCDKCNKFASYGFTDVMIKVRCAEHAEEGMNNLSTRQCKSCPRIAYYANPGETAQYCSEHKTESMVNLKIKRCLNCDKTATFNYEGHRGRVYCAEHAEEGMISQVMLYCKTTGCMTRGYDKYDGLCYRCYVNMNPDSETFRNFKTKERAVKDFLVEKWPDSIITHDKQVDCFKFRPDFVIELGSHVIVVEVDEMQHRSYDSTCDNKRLMSIFQGLGSRPMVVIRFNPDKYTDGNNKSVNGCWTQKGFIRRDTEWKRRLNVLESVINRWWCSAPEREVTVEHLFYDGFTQR